MLKKLILFYFLLSISIPIYAQQVTKEVTATKGDGIYSLLRKNGLDPTKHYQEFIKLNKKKLSDNNGLFTGNTYMLPIIKKDSITLIDTLKARKVIPKKITPKKLENAKTVETMDFPIFGKKYGHVAIENKDLKGAIYYLISGHGGPDPGATENYNGKLISEDEYAYDVTLRLARKLISKGAKVYIIIKDKNDGIRDKRILDIDYDEVCYPENSISASQKLRLIQRTKAVNNLYLKHKGAYQRLIVTHVDSRSKSKNIDVFFYHHNKSKSGKKLADNIHNTFKQKYYKYQPNRFYSGSVSSRGLYLIKNTLPPMVYIELGNIKNKKDQKRILNYENRDALANWISDGLTLDFERI